MQSVRKFFLLLQGAIGLLLLAGVGVNFANVFMRYGFGSPFPWTEEVMIFGLVFIVLAGTVVATARDDNLKIEVAQHLLPPSGRRALSIFGHLVWIGVSLFLATQSYTVVALMMRLGQTSMVTRVPTWIPHSVLLVSFVLCAGASVYAIIRELSGAQDEHLPPEAEAATGATDQDGAGR